jgi:hypothetical protein
VYKRQFLQNGRCDIGHGGQLKKEKIFWRAKVL